MATITDLDTKRGELNTAIANYKQALADFAAGSITLAQKDAARDAAQLKGDEYAKLAGQVKKDNPGEPEDNFFSNPGLMNGLVRDDVATIMTTGQFFGAGMKVMVDTEGNEVGATNVVLSFDTGSNVTVDWGDGTALTNYTGAASHNYATPGIYEVVIEGTVDGFTPPLSANTRQIKDISQWGILEFSSAKAMFQNRIGFTISASDAPTFLPGCSAESMFRNVGDIGSSINHWNTSNIVDMRDMFAYSNGFNSPIGNWDTSGVLNMRNMFFSNTTFNQPLNDWIIATGSLLEGMFRSASAFNQPLNKWDVSGISTSMNQMFENATSFNQDISMWDVSNVSSAVFFREGSALTAQNSPF